MTTNDPQLIAAARRGDQTACRRLFEAHGREVFRVCMRLLGNHAQAEDAVQDTFVNAFRALDQYDERASFGQWLRRIAINAVGAMVRKHSFRELATEPETLDAEIDKGDASSTAGDPIKTANRLEIQALVAVALDELTPLERMAFLMRHVEQHSLEEIAGAVGGNSNSVKQALFRGVRKLRLSLAPLREEWV